MSDQPGSSHGSSPSDGVPFVRRTPFGVVVGGAVEVLDKAALLARLHPEEAALAATWGEPRVRTFAAGRAVLREAIRAAVVGGAVAGGAGVEGAILRTARGAPVVPPGIVASVSHKDDVAVAIGAVARDGFFLGVDVETLPGPKDELASHILTDDERREVARIADEGARRREMALRFSLKESLYKAIDPTVQRYVGFHEVEVRPRDGGAADFTLALKSGEGFAVESMWFEVTSNLGRAVVTAVRVKLAG